MSAILLITKDFVKHLKIKNNAIKTWHFGDDMSPFQMQMKQTNVQKFREKFPHL